MALRGGVCQEILRSKEKDIPRPEEKKHIPLPKKKDILLSEKKRGPGPLSKLFRFGQRRFEDC